MSISLDTLFASTIEDTLTLTSMLTNLGMALLLGFFISFIYLKTHQDDSYAGKFIITLIMLPAIISVIIMLIGNNVARAFSLAGAFSLIRFRSAPGDPEDIAYIFFTLGVGLACGMGYIAYSIIFAVVLCAVMVLLHYASFTKPQAAHMQLKITVPENLNFQGLFDDILNQYTSAWSLKRVKTSDFGTLFEVSYHVNLNPGTDQKKFMDELRCRNGNLNISLTLKEYGEKNYA